MPTKLSTTPKEPPYKSWLMGILLAVITFALYYPALRHEFLNYDDENYVVTNPMVNHGFTREGVKQAIFYYHESNWHPLTWFSHTLDVEMYGLNPWGHHLTSVIFHVANSVLLFGLLVKITGRKNASAVVAALFAWHPLHIDSVAWVAERKDVLSAFFGLWSLWCYAEYVFQIKARGTKTERSGRWRAIIWLLMSVVMFALGLASKPMLVTLPLVMLLLDFWPFGRIDFFSPDWWKQLVKLLPEKWAFFGLSAVSCGITMLVQRLGGSVLLATVLPLKFRIENALTAYVKYLAKLIYPDKLAVFYPLPHFWPVTQIATAVVILAAVTAVCVWQMRQRPYWLMGWLWFVGMLVPVIGLVQVGLQAMANRYTYFPSIGFFIAVVWGVSDWCAGRGRIYKWAEGVLAGVALLACVVVTHEALPAWQDSYSLFSQALKVTQGNFIAENNLGVVLLGRGDYEEAAEHYKKSMRALSSFASAHYNLGVAWSRLNRQDDAVAEYKIGLSLEPDNAAAHFNLANSLSDLKRWPEAAAEYEASLRIEPNRAACHYLYGSALIQLGRNAEAMEQTRASLRLDPPPPEAHAQLARLLSLSAALGESELEYQRALQSAPDSPWLHSELGIVLARQNKFPEALVEFQTTARLDPNSESAHFNEGNVLFNLKRYQAAADEYTEALLLNPGDASARAKLARCREHF